MAGENNKLVKGLGAGSMQLTGDFALVDENGDDLFRVNASSGDVTSSGTFPGGSPSGAAGGDLSGTYPNPTVHRIEGIDISTTDPTAGQVLTATSASAAEWQTPASTTPGGGDTQVQFNDTGTFGGDSGLTYNKTTDTLTGVNLTLTGQLDATAGSIDAGSLSANTIQNNGMSDGSILYISSGGTLTQDNGNLFWDTALGLLRVGNGLTNARFRVQNDSNAILEMNNNGAATNIGNVTQTDLNLFTNDIVRMTIDSTTGDVTFTDNVDADSYSVNGTPGATAGPFTTITSITVVNGIVTDLQGS